MALETDLGQIEELSRFHETVDQAEGHAETARTVCPFRLTDFCGHIFGFLQVSAVFMSQALS